MLGIEDLNLRRKMQEFMRRQETEVRFKPTMISTGSMFYNPQPAFDMVAAEVDSSKSLFCAQVLQKADRLEECCWRYYQP